MESDADNMVSEKVSSTASENRKNSKPVMEKRRRARINASLAELKSLLLEVMKKEGARQNKMEKADILEITVRHLRTLQKQQFSALAANDPTLINKYRLGFNECASEVSNFLGSMEGTDTEIRSKLLNHLANCMVSSDPPAQSSRTQMTPIPESICTSQSQLTSYCKSDNDNHHFIAQPKPNDSHGEIHIGQGPNVLDTNVLAIRPQEPAIANTITASLPTSSTTTVSFQGLITGQPVHIQQPQIQQQQQQAQQFQHQIIPQPQMTQPLQIHTLPQQTNMQVQKVVSGVQLIPTKMSTGEMAFIIPANVVSGANLNNYVIPVLPSQPITSQVPTPVTPVTISCTQSTSPVGGIYFSNNCSPTVQAQNPKPVIAWTKDVDQQQQVRNNVQPSVQYREETISHSESNRNLPIIAASPPDKQDNMWRPW